MVGYSYLQAMRFAVEEINNSSDLLPGVSLGYEVEDVCYLTNTILPVLYFLSDNRSQVAIRTNWTEYRPRVVAVIGPDSSPASVSMAYVLSQFLIPQVRGRLSLGKGGGWGARAGWPEQAMGEANCVGGREGSRVRSIGEGAKGTRGHWGGEGEQRLGCGAELSTRG